MKKINFKKIFSIRNTASLLFIFGAIFLVGHFAFAENTISTALGNVVGGVIALFIRAISSILILLVGVLMNVAAYSDFINAPAVTKGWVVVRDVCNMFFVVILLIIAFATILGQEEYGAKKMLPKLIMAAVLINFSKLICGLMIDVSNVVMLTFVNAFSAIGAGNLLDVLGISSVTKIAVGADSAAVTFGTIVSAYIFGLIYVIIATVVVASMLGMLVIRVVMIWILVVLSPFAFFLQAVPGKGQQYAGQWWNKWTSNLLVGPIIAFFLWLSFAALQGGNPIAITDNNDLSANNSDIADSSGLGSEAATPSAMAKFVIAIGMLLGGMSIAQSVGGEAGSALGKGMSQLNKGKSLAIGAATGAAVATGAFAKQRTKEGALWAAGNAANAFGDRDATTGKKKSVVGDFALQWKDDLVSARKKEKVATREKYLKSIGITEKSAEAGKTMLNNAKIQTLGRVSKNASVYAGVGSLAGSAFGPVGTYVGGWVGAGVGSVAGAATGYISNKRYTNAKKYKEGYETSYNGQQSQKAYDSQLLNDIATKRTNGTALTPQELADEKAAIARQRQQDRYKKIIDNKDLAQQAMGGNVSFDRTNKAFGNMTQKKAAAQKWVGIAANNTDTLQNMGKGNIYSSAGISEMWKKRLDELNGGSDDANKAIDSMVGEISDPNALDDKQLKELAKLIAAYSGHGGSINPGTLGKIKDALIAKGNNGDYNPDNFAGKVTAQYKKAGEGMEVHAGTGGLQYNTFAANSAKAAGSRNASKDIMGASFEKINDKAKELGIDYKLDAAAGANQQVQGAQLGNLSKVMTGLIDDEIKSLQKIGGTVNSQKINELNVAKSRLATGDISGLSLKNSDVSYKGATATERRLAEYNTTQHEIMHQSGAKNEELVNDSAGALQESKLIGRIPKSDATDGGKRYDEVIGKIIANMEQSQATPDAIRAAVDSQIEKWTPKNAQRVIETESGDRDTIKEINPDTEHLTKKFDETVDRLIGHLEKETAPVSGNQTASNMSIDDRNFFMRTFNDLKKTVSRGDELVSKELKPLSAIAVKQETKRENEANRMKNLG